jgi:hypothetical protein
MGNNNFINGGAFQIARKIFESDLWLNKPATWTKIWVYILGNVNHKKNGKFERGEGFFNLTRELKNIGKDITSDMVKKFCEYARRSEMVSTRRSTRGIIIKVIKYDVYQSLGNYVSTSLGTREAREKHERSTTINKNDKNDKNVKKGEETPAQIANDFFLKGIHYEECVEAFAKKMDRGLVIAELEKFILYWTEPNKSGTRVRWEQQGTFDIKRRLITWFNNIRNIKINNKGRGLA